MKSFQTMEDYKSAALRLARFEKIDRGKTHFGEIPGFQGVWGSGATLAEAKRDLAEGLDGWIELRLEENLSLPAVKGVNPPAIHFA
jgi:predicted RNase H-like HicB family nuclease